MVKHNFLKCKKISKKHCKKKKDAKKNLRKNFAQRPEK